MKVFTERKRIVIVPEGPPDEMYLEQVLGMGAGGCAVRFVPPAQGQTGWGSIVFSAAEPQPVKAEPEPPVVATAKPKRASSTKRSAPVLVEAKQPPEAKAG